MMHGDLLSRHARRFRLVGVGWIFATALVFLAGLPTRGPAQEPEQEPRYPAALKSLGKRDKLRVVYFVPTDRKPTAHYREKTTVVMTFINDLYRWGLLARGHRTDGFDFEFENGKLLVHLIRGKKEAAYYSGAPNYKGMHQFGRVLKEVAAALGDPHENLYLVIPETYDEKPARIEWPGTVALGGRRSPKGGVAMFSAWILKDKLCATTVAGQLALFADETLIQGRRAHGHGGPDSPPYEFMEDGIGGLAHELGHALGVAHDFRSQGCNLMANGFRNIRYNYLPKFANRKQVGFSEANANFLANTRFLSLTFPSGDFARPSVELKLPKELFHGMKTFRISGTARDGKGLAAICYMLPGAGDVVAGHTLSGKKASFEQRLPFPRKAETVVKVRVVVTDRSGNHAAATAEIPIVKGYKTRR